MTQPISDYPTEPIVFPPSTLADTQPIATTPADDVFYDFPPSPDAEVYEVTDVDGDRWRRDITDPEYWIDDYGVRLGWRTVIIFGPLKETGRRGES